MTEKEKMLAGELYRAGDPELVADRRRAQELLRNYNVTTLADGRRRREILGRLLGGYGESVAIRAPFYCDYGYNIVLGRDVFLNFGCVLLDVCRIEIGDGTQIGPQVQIYAADHPRDPEARRQGLENGRPVTVGRNVWIGGQAILLPGITVGDDAVIGAGSVVTKDVPACATVVGNPARPVR
ncbi:sugar O-acetyltransferase [Caenispirillum bisanense]|uniref:Nodulation protein L n=1 Tax=Caenispirillum bisanense TaxID=414052 RepID=A0A286GEK3_9PROT|nr:sugar O-acetyltransferase [Caenispirillum bisanense]SOD93947.1 maltose O-acetyltransferase [Caenispirillum bisanense]